ncbi:MAG: GNAT family N-acetyltransferase [Rhodobacter sp.]|jgi:predicted GNAT superfamily acetyltransferase|nr:GNAT family N-acetyltransferase [Rhodobacter sp.]
MSNVLFRDLSGMAEFRAAEDLQRQVWGDGDLPDPADLMMVIQAEGGLVGGAFADDRLVGYIFGFPTRDPQVQHSHRLAVLAQTRGMGLGVRLKLYQRDWCLARGISRVRWTFDPLRALNASLNIDRLGAQSDTYLENYYGDMGGINSGMGSDRLLVDWNLAAPWVAGRAVGASGLPERGVPLDVALPDNIEQLAAERPVQAESLRIALRSALQSSFAKGGRIIGFDRHSRVYLMARR